MIKESIAMGKSMISDEQLTNLSLRLFSSVSTWINKTNNSFYEIVKMNDPTESGGLNTKLSECLLQSHKILEIIKHISLHDYRNIDIKHSFQEVSMFKELWNSFSKIIDEEYPEYDHILNKDPTYVELHNVINNMLFEVQVHKKENINHELLAHFTTDNSIKDYLTLFFESEIPFIKSFLNTIAEKSSIAAVPNALNDFMPIYNLIISLEEMHSSSGLLISPATDDNQKKSVIQCIKTFIKICDFIISKADKTEENEFSIKNTNIKLEHAKAVLRDIESF